MTSPVFTEGWVNPTDPDTTVTSPGGTTATAGNETWLMGGGYLQFPAADPNAIPPSLFRVYDRDNPAEAILVRQTIGNSWQVTRADQGTPPVAHAPGFAVHSLLSPAGLQALAHGVPSANGLVLPRAARVSESGNLNGTASYDIGTVDIPAGEAVPGSVYEITAWGRFDGSPDMTFTLTWGPQAGGVGLGTNRFQTGQAVTGGNIRWKTHSIVSVLGIPGNLTASGHTFLWQASHNTVWAPGQYPLRRYMFGPGQQNAVTNTAAVTLRLWGQKAVGGYGMVLMGSKGWRAA